jgi:hypothetical protein
LEKLNNDEKKIYRIEEIKRDEVKLEDDEMIIKVEKLKKDILY